MYLTSVNIVQPFKFTLFDGLTAALIYFRNNFLCILICLNKFFAVIGLFIPYCRYLGGPFADQNCLDFSKDIGCCILRGCKALFSEAVFYWSPSHGLEIFLAWSSSMKSIWEPSTLCWYYCANGIKNGQTIFLQLQCC